MSLFRKKALDALSTPEQLDQPLQLLRPGYWALLFSLLGFAAYLLIWSFLGRLPIRIKGKGVLTTPNTMHLIQAETSGRVMNMSVELGGCVQNGDSLATIEPVQLELQQIKVAEELERLIADDLREQQYTNQRLTLQQQELERWQKVAGNGGFISVSELSRHVQKTRALQAQLLTEDNRRDQAIHQQRLALANIKREISRTSVIRAEEDGCILGRHVQNGQMVQPGTTLFEFDSRDGSASIKSLAFFPAKDGKRLKNGQSVRVTPTTTKPQRHGGIQGVITSVRPLPVSYEALKLRLGNEAIVKSVSPTPSSNGGSSTPLIEVTTSLAKDKNTISGYDWGGGDGPDLQLTSGTTTIVSVIVEERAPISYVIPLLRDLSGIY